MKRKKICLAVILLGLVGFLTSYAAEDQQQLYVYRVSEEFDPRRPFYHWEAQLGENCSLYKEWNGISLRMYAVYNKNYLHFGFLIRDPFLSFTDDYSLDFAGSDHLRLYFKFPVEKRDELAIFIHPYSKIKEPLCYLSDVNWRHSDFLLSSHIEQGRYFLSVSIPLAETGLSPRRGQRFSFKGIIYSIEDDGSVREYCWGKAEEYLTLFFR